MQLLQLLFVLIAVLLSSEFCSALGRIGNDVEPSGGAVESLVVAKTITVDRLGRGDFTRIQSAIDSVPSHGSKWIRIRVRSGIYEEKVIVPRNKPFIMLEGDSPQSTIITSGDAQVMIESAALSVLADNFIARRITFKNTYNRGNKKNRPKQALAAFIYGDKCSFYQCGFIGLQDTLLDCMGRHHFKSCYIEGAIDFIFGAGQSIYDRCAINVTADQHRIPFGYITAQGRENPNEQNGFVFKYCRVFGTIKAYLGRPWRAYSRVLFYQSDLSGIVMPQGWDSWNLKGKEQSVTFAEEGCTGSGSNTNKRVRWAKKLSNSEVNKLASLSFIDNEGWIQRQPMENL